HQHPAAPRPDAGRGLPRRRDGNRLSGRQDGTMNAAAQEGVVFSHLGEAGLLCEHAPGPLDLARQRRIWAVADAIGARPGIREVIPGMNNLVVLYDPLAFAPD